MRNLEERLAEISRRSDEIVKKRTRRRAALAACTPLVLCLVLTVALLVPQGLSVPTSGSGDTAGPAGVREELYPETQAVAGEIKRAVQEIRVEGYGFSMAHTDVESMMEIRDLLEELTTRVPDIFAENNESTANYSAADIDPPRVGDVPDTVGYTVSVVSESGTTEYHLQGSLLKNVQTGQIYVLSEKDYFALKDALGIPLY